MSNKSRDTRSASADIAADVTAADTGITRDITGDVQSLNARSLALSALLGTHPPALPARGLVALAELFGIAAGTMRTALSRMATAGEVTAGDGWYELTGRLLARQHSQDIGRHPPDTTWDGTWHTVIAGADQRDLAERRRFRSALTDHRFGELRPDIWLRPANLPTPQLDAITITGPIDGGDGLVERLWDLEQIRVTANRLGESIVQWSATTDVTSPDAIPATFTLAATVLRFLRAEPHLPPGLTPPAWPVDALRREFEGLEHALQRTLRDFLRPHRR